MEVNRIFKHPKYESINPNYNIAILELLSQIEFSDTVSAAGLSKIEWPLGANGFATGFQPADIENRYISVLEGTTMEILKDKECPLPIFNRKQMLCIGDKENLSDTCLWSSGSPIIFNNILVGIFNDKLGCMSGMNRVYTSVSAFHRFIMESIYVD